ncbi:MAG: peptidoglycan editing factor PgeF [Oscillatoria sp. PMC 1068.18]|nr:peptidoglycan editing factor PgeF [Oscillatoria sp. PMC 1076.18]MEC4991086.1 peptidoglycan editing factor PgeF [Oscillatoria sp. PMC 1068.18]
MLSNSISNPQTLTPSWQWQNWRGLPYLTCSLLADWQHGFFTQQFDSFSPQQLTEIFQPKATAYRLKQVHGNAVLTPTEIETEIASKTEEIYAPGDGIITNKSLESVWVASADCTPILIADRVTGKVAGVHAGWRGTAQKIVPVAIARFLSFGSSREDLLVAMGPAIAGEVYQVSETVAAEIGASIIPQTDANDKEKMLIQLAELADSPLFPDSQPGKVKIDVRRINQIQLEQLGLRNEQMAIAPFCTYQQPEHFFSYRRSKQKKVQWSGIVSK